MSHNMFSASIDGFNRVFSYLANQQNMVCWIRSLDYERQLYLSPQFETVFGGSCSSLYKHPKSWWDYLIPNDTDLIHHEIDSRIAKPTDVDGNSTILFRIQSHNEIRYIRDTCMLVYNECDKPIAIAGVGEQIQPELWYQLKNRSIKNNISYPGGVNVVDIIKNENKHLYSQNVKRKKIITDKLFVNGIKVSLTKREAEVLKHLRMGKTAKETAQDIFLSPRTVETHLENIKQKTCCRTKLELLTKLKEDPWSGSNATL